MKPRLRYFRDQHDLKTAVRSNFVQKWLRNKLLHFWLAALANSAYLVFLRPLCILDSTGNCWAMP